MRTDIHHDASTISACALAHACNIGASTAISCSAPAALSASECGQRRGRREVGVPVPLLRLEGRAVAGAHARAGAGRRVAGSGIVGRNHARRSARPHGARLLRRSDRATSRRRARRPRALPSHDDRAGTGRDARALDDDRCGAGLSACVAESTKASDRPRRSSGRCWQFCETDSSAEPTFDALAVQSVAASLRFCASERKAPGAARSRGGSMGVTRSQVRPGR